MIKPLRNKTLYRVILCAAFVIGACAFGNLAAAQAPDATLALVPSATQIGVQEACAVDVRVSDVQELYAYQVRIDYNPAILSVLDADGNKTNGVQVRLGSFMRPDLVQTNRVDEAEGHINVVVTQMNPTAPVSGGGVLFSIDFEAAASGVSAVRVAPYPVSMLTNRDAEPFDVTITDTQIEVVLTQPDPPAMIYLPLICGRAIGY